MLSRILLVAAILVLLGGGAAYAQNATVAGSVVDQSKALLPGATVTATDVSTGRQFVALTTERGEYRLAGVMPGKYTLQAELAGFTSSVISDVELLVGQN